MLQRRLPVRGAVRAALAIAAIALPGCLPLPVHTARSVEGRVVDAATGRPLAGAIVVVRFDARHGDVLPSRELLGHVEVRTDANGRFETGSFVRPGLTVVPLVRTEVRLAGVMIPGYRCPRPALLDAAVPARIALQRAADADARRRSCRPIAAVAREIPRYLAAWRDLYPRARERDPRGVDEDERLDRLLAARRVFGFGQNCEGPVLDLALAPGGARFAYLARVEGGARVAVDGLDRGRGPEWIALHPSAGSESARLAWTDRGELVLWEAGLPDHTAPSSLLALAGAAPEVIWRQGAAPPAAADPAAPLGRPLELADLHDEGDARWNGRSFSTSRTLDPVSGLPIDWLNVRGPDGGTRAHELPGEVCGALGRFGRPQERIAADGRTALDLRFVDGGCRPVAIDLESGRSRRLDRLSNGARCQAVRRIPPSQIGVALAGYAGEIQAALASAGADPAAAYTLRVAPGGPAEVDSRDPRGHSVRAPLPSFPVETPLRQIEVSAVGGTAPGERIVSGIEPL